MIGSKQKPEKIKTAWCEVVGKSKWNISKTIDRLSEFDNLRKGAAEGKIDIVEDDDNFTIIIPAENAKYRKALKTVQTCVFDATNKYLESFFGRKMDSMDKAWFEGHPRTTSKGVDSGDEMTMVNDLVRPYGLGVKEVFIRSGSVTSAHDEWKKWMDCLGINDMAVTDRKTSNKEFLDLLPEIAREAYTGNQWNWQYSDIFIGPAIVFCKSQSSTSVATFASGGGHCSYTGPRGYFNGWQIAIKLDFIEKINYLAEVPTFGNATPEDSYEIDFMSCLDSAGNEIRKIVWSSYSYNGGGNNYQTNGHYVDTQYYGKTKTRKEVGKIPGNGYLLPTSSMDCLTEIYSTEAKADSAFRNFIRGYLGYIQGQYIQAYELKINKEVCDGTIQSIADCCQGFNDELAALKEKYKDLDLWARSEAVANELPELLKACLQGFESLSKTYSSAELFYIFVKLSRLSSNTSLVARAVLDVLK